MTSGVPVVSDHNPFEPGNDYSCRPYLLATRAALSLKSAPHGALGVSEEQLGN